jgi:hypothetical protein
LSCFLKPKEHQSRHSPSSVLGGGEPPWSRSLSRFIPDKDPVNPHVVLPQDPHVVPWRARERSSDEPPPHGAVAPDLCAAPSAGFDVSRLRVDEGPGLDYRYPFILTKIRAVDQRINNRESSTMSWTHELKPWTRSMGP